VRHLRFLLWSRTRFALIVLVAFLVAGRIGALRSHHAAPVARPGATVEVTTTSTTVVAPYVYTPESTTTTAQLPIGVYDSTATP
jgi:hypothetical protein